MQNQTTLSFSNNSNYFHAQLSACTTAAVHVFNSPSLQHLLFMENALCPATSDCSFSTHSQASVSVARMHAKDCELSVQLESISRVRAYVISVWVYLGLQVSMLTHLPKLVAALDSALPFFVQAM